MKIFNEVSGEEKKNAKVAKEDIRRLYEEINARNSIEEYGTIEELKCLIGLKEFDNWKEIQNIRFLEIFLGLGHDECKTKVQSKNNNKQISECEDNEQEIRDCEDYLLNINQHVPQGLDYLHTFLRAFDRNVYLNGVNNKREDLVLRCFENIEKDEKVNIDKKQGAYGDLVLFIVEIFEKKFWSEGFLEKIIEWVINLSPKIEEKYRVLGC